MSNPNRNPKPVTPSRNLRSRRTGLLVVATLAAVTLGGHLMTRQSAAVPTVPGVAPTPPPGTSFAAPTASPVAFSGRLDRTAVMTGGDGRVKMELILAAEDRPAENGIRTPTDLVVVLDRSGSMSGEKIVHARAAVHQLISRLGPGDRFALVAYSSRAGLEIPLAPATAEARGQWSRAVAAIEPTGGTNMSAGLDLGLAVAGDRGRARRLLLISDGHANEGDPTIEGLAGRARRAVGLEAVVSAIGVGADFDEYLMSTVADAGTGNFYYLQDVERLAEVFDAELSTTRETVASALAVTIEPASGVEVVDAAGYPLEHEVGKTVFRPGSLFAGQERRIWVTLEVPHRLPGEHALGTFTASYSLAGENHTLAFAEIPEVACVGDSEVYYAAIDGDAWARSAVEDGYNRLRQEVARHVRAGRRDRARDEIQRYQVENETLNVRLQRDEVKQKLEELRRLEAEVDDAFEGPNQRHKQNLLSKENQAAGLDGRRPGSKRGASR